MAILPKPLFTNPPTDLHPEPSVAERRPALISVMMGRLLDAVKYKFSTPDNIYRDELKHLIYTKDQSTTAIYIMPGFETTGNDQQADTFPRVVMSAGQLSIIPALEGVSHGQYATSEEYTKDGVFQNGSIHSAGISGQLSIKAVSRGSLEALLIAEDIFMWLLTLRTVLERDLTLSDCGISVVSGPKPSEQYKGCYEADVPVSWSSGMCWRLTPPGPPLAEMS